MADWRQRFGERSKARASRWLWLLIGSAGVLLSMPFWSERQYMVIPIVGGWWIGAWAVWTLSRTAATFPELGATTTEDRKLIDKRVDPVLDATERTRSVVGFTPDEVREDDLRTLLADANAVEPGIERDKELLAQYTLSALTPNYPLDAVLTDESARNQVKKMVRVALKQEESRRHIEEAAKHSRELAELTREVAAEVVEVEAGSSFLGEYCSGHDLVVIAHGTWARDKGWWQPNGEFFQMIAENRNVVGFGWDGGNWDGHRQVAAAELASWWKSHRKDICHLDIVAHSHGGNVALRATAEDLGLEVRTMILLGTPMRLEYLPDMRRIKRIFNIFALDDKVQDPVGTKPSPRGEGRTLADSDSIVNICLPLTSFMGAHGDLHDPGIWKEYDLMRFVPECCAGRS